ncbi:phage tail assembly chaperone [Pantoea brenneri]|uniref:phage tail assembly chaperone n=1 Tax=Pantoea brenneri TaxID=472694 RepID=UPI00244ABA6C|nr:phage tail assembly chaperone [Pantoea brenneri]MDH2121661.1 phage tail assembly chaperone [Pantoea brenneri]
MSKTAQTSPSPSSLRSLALAASGAFRTKTVTVPEWENASVTLREPSGEAWLKFRNIVSPEPEAGEELPKLTQTETFMRNKEADVVMFIDVLLDESGNRVFSDEDMAIVSEIYGPVHGRLLSQALRLGMSQEDAEAK